MRRFIAVLLATLWCCQQPAPAPAMKDGPPQPSAKAPAAKKPAEPPNANRPCLPANAPVPQSRHLGDGVHSNNYYFIGQEIERRPGSPEETREIEKHQNEAQRSSGMNRLKPPSANVVESEFSHLLGVVMQSNGGVGASVFNRHGLKIGAAGVQLESMVLPTGRRNAVNRIRPNGPPLEERYTCERLRELAKACDPAATRGVPCWELRELVKSCTAPLVAYYRPASDYTDDDSTGSGVTLLVVRDKPRCEEP